MLTISIVIPVYNSEATIGELCDLLIEELGLFYRVQIVLVNDGSTDHSCVVCRNLHERHPEVIDCITLSRNFGEHNAVMAGLHYAEGDYTVIMDDDFQNPPSEVRKLVEEIKNGHDVVYARYDTKHHSLFRNLGSRLHNWMATRALGKPADLYLSSFKILSRFLVQEIVRYTGPDPYLDAILLRITRKIGVVTVLHAPRARGGSGYTFGKLLSLWGSMFMAFSLYPLRLVAAVGSILALIGFGYAGWIFFRWLLPDSMVRDPAPDQISNAIRWFLSGMTLVALGIIGEYVGRNYMHLNSDPQFIVRDAKTRHSHHASIRREFSGEDVHVRQRSHEHVPVS